MFKLFITGDIGFEFWMDIPGYEGLYQASTYGRVRSHKSKRYKGRILSPAKSNNGYSHIILAKEGVHKTWNVHRLVALTFLPNPKNLPVVNHKDEMRDNCRVENLEFCTVQYNTNYNDAIQKSNARKRIPVIQETIDGTFVRRYDSIAETRAYGFNKKLVSLVCRNRLKATGGYVFRFETTPSGSGDPQ